MNEQEEAILREKLARHTDKSAGPDGCWIWTGSKSDKGYGYLMNKLTSKVAHRIAYELACGPIPDGLTIDHLCRNRACVNPSHLEAVTNKENVLRGMGLTAQNARKTHCLRGHPYDEANTIYDGTYRRCRTCYNESRRGKHRPRKRSKKPHCRVTPRPEPLTKIDWSHDIAEQLSGNDLARFWAKVDKSGECWLWIGWTDSDGLGRFWYHEQKISAARVSYCLHFGALSEGARVANRCGCPSCVRPEHLYVKTTSNKTDV